MATLFVSFWDICLDNLPEGVFRRHRLTPDAARSRIEEARQKNSLICVSGDDLFAPYCVRELQSHEDLCRLLSRQFGIELSLADFTGGEDSVLPLEVARVADEDRLLVVTCSYMIGEPTPERPVSFATEPGSIEFHLFELAQTDLGL